MHTLIGSITYIARGNPAGYKVESQSDQLCLTWKLIWASLEAVIITEQETIAIHDNQSIGGDSKMKSDRIYCEQRLVESDYEHNPHAWVLTPVRPKIEHRYDTSYAVSLAQVMWLRETLVVCE